MFLFCKSILVISLLLFCSLLFRTTNFVVATANPSCAPANQRTISLRVENRAGARVDNLRPEDLSLLEDKTSREILTVDSKTDEPLAIAILIDTSVSQEHLLPQVRLAAQEFVEAIPQTKKNRIAVVSFTGKATVEEDLTNDLARVQSAISRVKFVPPGDYLGSGVVVSGRPPISGTNQILAGSTAIWDAVWASTDGILKAATDSRRAILLFTDGEDTSSSKKLREAIEYAARYDVAVFGVGIADKQFGSTDRKALNKLSEETGGRAFFPKKAEDLPEILRQIDQELRSHHSLTYCATSVNTASQLSQIKIELKNPPSQASDLRILYRHYGL